MADDTRPMAQPTVNLDRLRVGTLWRLRGELYQVTDMNLHDEAETRRGLFGEQWVPPRVTVHLEFGNATEPADGMQVANLDGQSSLIVLDGECWQVRHWEICYGGDYAARVSLSREPVGDLAEVDR